MTGHEFLLSHGWQLALMLVLLTGSAFCSGTETAMFNLTRGQLHRFARSQHRLSRLVATLMQQPQQVLNTLLLGNMLVNIAFASTAAVIAIDLEQRDAGPVALTVAAAAPLLMLILFGEVMPKAVAFVLCERWAPLAAVPLSVLRRLLMPPLYVLWRVFVGPLATMLSPPRLERAEVTAEELEALLDLSAKHGVIDHDSSELMQEIIGLEGIRVRDVMVPRVDMIAFDVSAPPGELADLFRTTHLRKIPAYEADLDHVLGVVHAKRFFLSPASPLRQLVRPVSFLPEAANLERALLHFRTKRTQMAIVVDEYGGTAGLVSLEDVLEEIVGDISDARDGEHGPAVERIGEHEYRLDADLAIHEWAEAFGVDLSDRRISTVGGFVCSLLGRIPRVGDTATYRNLRFTVEGIRKRRLGALRLELLEERP